MYDLDFYFRKITLGTSVVDEWAMDETLSGGFGRSPGERFWDGKEDVDLGWFWGGGSYFIFFPVYIVGHRWYLSQWSMYYNWVSWIHLYPKSIFFSSWFQNKFMLLSSSPREKTNWSGNFWHFQMNRNFFPGQANELVTMLHRTPLGAPLTVLSMWISPPWLVQHRALSVGTGLISSPMSFTIPLFLFFSLLFLPVVKAEGMTA